MKTMPPNQTPLVGLFHTVALTSLMIFTGCVSHEPIAEAQGKIVDERLVGTWRCVDGETKYFYEKGDLYRVFYWDKENYAILGVGGEDELCRIYPVTVSGENYYVICGNLQKEEQYLTIQIRFQSDERITVRTFNFGDDVISRKDLRELIEAPSGEHGWTDWATFERID